MTLKRQILAIFTFEGSSSNKDLRFWQFELQKDEVILKGLI